MYFGCKCLNVSIKSKGSELKNINVDDIELSVKEQVETFFNNNVAVVEDFESIKTEQSGLLEVKNLGVWAVHRCQNCLTYTHAVHRDSGPTLVLINTDIITSQEEVNILKTSINYSPVFRIIIDSDKVQELDLLEPHTKLLVSHLPNSTRLALANLEQQLEQAIHQKAHLIDEKIREYTKQQYEILDKFKERAHAEHSFLTRMIRTKVNSVNGTNSVDNLEIALQNTESNRTTSVNAANTKANVISQNTTMKQQLPHKSRNTVHANGSSKTDARMKDTTSYDGETIFFLDGMDDGPIVNRHLQVSDQESDTDDSGNEAIHIPRNHRSGHPTLAKSLPVTVPVFHSFNQRSMQDDDDEQISRDPMDPHNIQASIKALAKSVHGDTVFGDLPRPRFSTQI